jgi:hypothetical protein
VAWIGAALMPAFQPARLIAGFVLALAVWLPGLGWDALTGANIDATGLLAEPYDDAEQAEVQAALRRLAREYAPDAVFEGARVPARELAAILEASAGQAPDAGSRDMLMVAAAHAGSLAPLGTFAALLQAESRAAGMAIDGLLSAAPADVALGARLALWDTPRAVWERDRVFAVVFGLWCALTLAVGAGALARMEASQLSGRGTMSAPQAFGFAAGRWADLVLAWLAPLAIAGGLGMVCLAWGMLFRNEWSAWLGGALYVVPLLVGTVAGLALVLWGLGLPLAPAAVACDGLDAMDAAQRGAAYAIGRPGTWVVCAVVVAIVAVAGLAVARIVAWVITGFTAATVGLGAGLGRAEGADVVLDSVRVMPDSAVVAWGGPGAVASWWVTVASVIVAGAFLSLLAGLLTRAYLVLRERCDGQGVFEVWPFERPSDVSDDHVRAG